MSLSGEERERMVAAVAVIADGLEGIAAAVRGLVPAAPPIGRPRVEPADRFCKLCGGLIPKVSARGRRRGPAEYDRLDYCSRGHAISAGWEKKRLEAEAALVAEPDRESAVVEPAAVTAPAARVPVDPALRRERLAAAKAARSRSSTDHTASQVLGVLTAAGRPLSSLEVTVALVGRNKPEALRDQAHRRIAPVLSALVACGKATRVRAQQYGDPTRYQAVSS